MPVFNLQVNGLNRFMRSSYNKQVLKIFFIFIALVGCDNTNHNPPETFNYQSLKMFPQGKSFSGFQLTSNKGKQWQAKDFKGNYSLVFFGFANCPDICPTTLLDMQKINHALESVKVSPPNFIFISVDPDRDTPEILDEYITYFNPEFIALTGDQANILSIATQLGVAYKVAEHEKGDLVYDVDHASALFVLNPEGERIGLFSAPHNVKNITADLTSLLDKT